MDLLDNLVINLEDFLEVEWAGVWAVDLLLEAVEYQEVVEAEEAVVAAEDIKNHQNLNSILELRIRILLIWMTNLFLMTLRKIPLTKLVNYFTG